MGLLLLGSLRQRGWVGTAFLLSGLSDLPLTAVPCLSLAFAVWRTETVIPSAPGATRLLTGSIPNFATAAVSGWPGPPSPALIRIEAHFQKYPNKPLLARSGIFIGTSKKLPKLSALAFYITLIRAIVASSPLRRGTGRDRSPNKRTSPSDWSFYLVLQRGFEPRTPCLKGRCSAY